MLNIDLTGKKAFVTGGSRGVGRSICEVLADCGADVAFTYRSRDAQAREVVDAICEKTGKKAFSYKCDVGNFEAMKQVMSDVKNAFGTLDIIVNNAGKGEVCPMDELTPEKLESMLQTNVCGPFYSLMAGGLDMMLAAGGGSIINIGSQAMHSGMGGGPHYSSSKSALQGLTRYMAITYGPQKIRCNTLAISLVQTEMLQKYDEAVKQEKIATVPIRRLSEPEDAAYMTAFLCSDLGSYVTGEMITIDGGRTFA